MTILVVAAMRAEIAPLIAALGADGDGGDRTAHTYASHDIDLLTTGVGMVPTAARCAKALAGGADGRSGYGALSRPRHRRRYWAVRCPSGCTG
jgi:nucleoside phosphorylase